MHVKISSHFSHKEEGKKIDKQKMLEKRYE